MTVRQIGAFLLAGVVTWLIPAVGPAWVPLNYQWRELPVVYHLDSTRVDASAGGPGLAIAEAALTAGISQWNATGSSFRASYGGPVTGGSRGDFRNDVYWLRTWDPALGDTNTVLAVSAPVVRLTGETMRTAVEGNVIFNGETYDWAGGIPRRRDGGSLVYTLQGTMLHELGHALGLAHSDVAVAVMRSRRPVDYRMCQADDQAGALGIYPPGAPLCTLDRQCPGVGGNRARCGPGGQAIPPGALGATCSGSDPCAPGLRCRGLGGPFRCTQDCANDAACGGGTFCVNTTEGGLCWPPGATPIGGACSFNHNCQSALCVTGVCSQPCSEDCACDVGERCRALGAGWREPGYCLSGDSTCVRCGDGIVAGPEACDDGSANDDETPDRCRTDCTAPRCGDGVVDTGEACDDGDANSDTEPDRCRTDCQPARCGDGVVDTAEACDDGAANSDSVPGCRTTCRLSTCGDGVVTPPEACDDGDANSDSMPGACRTDCREARCGDGVVDGSERCDDGADNANDLPDRCRLDCQPARCGDGVIDTGETCDDANVEDGDGCASSCGREPSPPRPGTDADVPLGADGGVVGDAAATRSPELKGTCTCRVHPESGASPMWIGLMLLGLTMIWRRRR